MLYSEEITKKNRREVIRLLKECFSHFGWQEKCHVMAEDVKEMEELAIPINLGEEEILTLEYGMKILYLSEEECQIKIGEEEFFSITAEYVDIYTFSRKTEEFSEVFILEK